jgi:hypothetical protein
MPMLSAATSCFRFIIDPFYYNNLAQSVQVIIFNLD